MAGHTPKQCPRCGGTLADKGGFDKGVEHGVLHGAAHGIKHADPLFLGLAAAGAAARFFFPKKLACPRCGYSVKA